jgi:DNA-directed RNA polymerase specialized sigma24 family protein
VERPERGEGARDPERSGPVAWACIAAEVAAIARGLTRGWPNAAWNADEVASEALSILAGMPPERLPTTVRERGRGGWLQRLVEHAAGRVGRAEAVWAKRNARADAERCEEVESPPTTPYAADPERSVPGTLPDAERRVVALLLQGTSLAEIARLEDVEPAEVERRGRWAAARLRVPELASDPGLGREPGSLGRLPRARHGRVAERLLGAGWDLHRVAEAFGRTQEAVRSLVRRRRAQRG